MKHTPRICDTTTMILQIKVSFLVHTMNSEGVIVLWSQPQIHRYIVHMNFENIPQN